MTKMFLEIPKQEGNMENQIQEDQFMKDMEYHDTYGASCGFETRWSIYSDNEPIFGVQYNGMMGEKSPFVPGTVITNKCPVWGYDASAVVGGKGLWCDVWLACDSVIRNSVDSDGNRDHHIFIEGFERNQDGTFQVVTGS